MWRVVCHPAASQHVSLQMCVCSCPSTAYMRAVLFMACWPQYSLSRCAAGQNMLCSVGRCAVLCRYLALGRKRSLNKDEDVKRQVYGLLQVSVTCNSSCSFVGDQLTHLLHAQQLGVCLVPYAMLATLPCRTASCQTCKTTYPCCLLCRPTNKQRPPVACMTGLIWCTACTRG